MSGEMKNSGMKSGMIGGVFAPEPQVEEPTNWFTHWPEITDTVHMMSGRCALGYCLRDYLLRFSGKRCYVPAYTCETVLAPYEQLGMELIFYDFDLRMTPRFDQAMLGEFDILHIAGYYGFSSYDEKFVRQAHDAGAIIIQDLTHSLFSFDGLSPLADYAAGSARKWLGVAAGGIAYKRGGSFLLPPEAPDEEHLSRRFRLLDGARSSTGVTTNEMNDRFWAAEGMLRQMFSYQASDLASIELMEHVDVTNLQARRRANYQTLLDLLLPTEFAPHIVFPVLDPATVPSHFTILYPKRDLLQQKLLELGIKTTAYWPTIPAGTEEFTAATIYRDVLSLPMDQRYDESDMKTVATMLLQADAAISAES